MSASVLFYSETVLVKGETWNKACKQKALMVRDDVNQDMHYIGACIDLVSYKKKKKSVSMHTLLSHKTAQQKALIVKVSARALMEL